MNLLDTLTPATPPEAKGARVVRPLDVDPIDLTTPAPAIMNNKNASLRALLRDTPDGLDYDQMSRSTGIARDRIAAHVSTLMRDGDAKKFIEPGTDRVYFKFSGDLARVGPRLPEQQPAPKPNAGATSEPKTAAPPPPQRVPPQDARTASAAVPEQKPAAPQAPSVARPRADAPTSSVIEPAVAAAPVQQTEGAPGPGGEPRAPAERLASPSAPAEPNRDESTPGQAGISSDRATGMGAGSPLKAPSDHISQPGKKVRVEPIDLLTEMAILSAALLAAEVRSAAIYLTAPALERALRNFERADKLREEAKAERG